MTDILGGFMHGGIDDTSLLFFFLLLVVIFCNCGICEDDTDSLLFFFLLLVVILCNFCGNDDYKKPRDCC